MVNIGKTTPEFDYLLLSSETASLPTERVPEGSTAYVCDTKKLLIFHDGVWYEM